jgi:hypothetical protein
MFHISICVSLLGYNHFSFINVDCSNIYYSNLKHGVDMLESIQSVLKISNKRKSLKVVAAFFLICHKRNYFLAVLVFVSLGNYFSV